MYEIMIFSLNTCNHCVQLKNELKNKNYPFTEIEITSNEDLWDQVVNQTNDNIVPTVFIRKNNTDEGIIYIPGKDFNSPEELIEKIKKYF